MKTYIKLDDAIEAVARADTSNGTQQVFTGLDVIKILRTVAGDMPEQIKCVDCEYKGPLDQYGIHYCKHIGKWATDKSSCDIGEEV